MRRLNRYLISNTIKLLFISEFAGIVIFTMIEFFEHVDLFTRSFSDFGLGITYILLKVPYYFSLILPLSFLISILILIIIMIRGNEVIVLRTAGISTLSLMKPLVIFSLVLVVLSFCLSEWIIPFTSSTAEYIYRVKVKKEQAYVFLKNDKIWFKRGNTICNIDFFDAKKDEIRGLTVLELSNSYSIQKRYDAKTGVWKDGSWVFSEVIERTFRNDGIESKTAHKTLSGLINEPPSVFKIVDKSPEEMSYKELQRYITRLKRNGHDVKRYMVDLYSKIAFPFINVIMVLAAFSVGLRYAKTKNVSKGIFSGISLGILYWFFHSVALSLGYSEIFPPLFAAWFSNLLFFSFGIIGTVTVRT
ncbi:MAG: Lipopolysaccharide export system permease protein LptG [Syntrophorhabdaceae bacterium PtaU1.Bin034]|nr:MAG: Lipopolysaccharide export system permease protein LptG [Syntrophorhabdaceae bacterium PtaU1.Bin034]